MSNNSHGTEQPANNADSRGPATPDSPGSVRSSVREPRDRVILVVHIATAHIASRRVELGSDGVLASFEMKSSAVDPVTVVGHEPEELIRPLIRAFNSSDRILDEGGELDDGAGPQAQAIDVPEPVTWIVDPIDGIANFPYGPPSFAVSIACVVGGEIVAGAVVNVYLGETYCATKGEGAQVSRRDGTVQTLSCSPTTELGKTLTATGPSHPVSLWQVQGRIVSQLLEECRGTQHMGPVTFDLRMVTHDRVGVYYEHNIKTWDYAAGVLIAAETGARIKAPEFSECISAVDRPEEDPLNFGVGAANPEATDVFYEALDGTIPKVRSQCIDLGAGAQA